MMSRFKCALLAVAMTCSAGFLAGSASALPMSNLATAAKSISDAVEDVRVVCGPIRCWWRPGPYWRGAYWRPRAYWGLRYGWRPRPLWARAYWRVRPYWAVPYRWRPLWLRDRARGAIR